jgi:beta-glucanase (GH16 family)
VLVGVIAAVGGYAGVVRVREKPQTEVLTGEKPGQVFVVNHGFGETVIRQFDPRQGHKIRLAGFGITRFAALRPMMRQSGSDVEVALPGRHRLIVTGASLADLSAPVFQLELDRTHLIKTFSDEFDTFSWDSEEPGNGASKTGTWRTNFGYAAPGALMSRSLVQNGELEIYADANFRGTARSPLGLNPFRVVNGVLEISAVPVPEDVRPLTWNRQYASGLITTRHSFAQQYGVFEMRARLPKGRGLWPAFWLLPPSGAWPPEIDILESIGGDSYTLYTSWHSLETNSHTTETIETKVPDLSADFHTYALEWTKEDIKWFFDGIEVASRSTPADMHRPMYILANLAVGGGWAKEPDASTKFPAIFAIDWIRVYRREEAQ